MRPNRIFKGKAYLNGGSEIPCWILQTKYECYTLNTFAECKFALGLEINDPYKGFVDIECWAV